MANKMIISKCVDCINDLLIKEKNLIKIIHTIDFHLCNYDDDVINLVSIYFNDILNNTQSKNSDIILIKKKLTII